MFPLVKAPWFAVSQVVDAVLQRPVHQGVRPGQVLRRRGLQRARPIRLTVRPVRPRWVYSIVSLQMLRRGPGQAALAARHDGTLSMAPVAWVLVVAASSPGPQQGMGEPAAPNTR